MSASALHYEAVIRWIVSFNDPDLLRQAVRFASGPARVRLATAYWDKHPNHAAAHLVDLIISGPHGLDEKKSCGTRSWDRKLVVDLYLVLLGW